MNAYLFKLDAPASPAFKGVVAIIITKERHEMWTRFTVDDNARHIPHAVAYSDRDGLSSELAALGEGTEIKQGSGLVRQLFKDWAESADYRVTFIGRRTFTMLQSTPQVPREQSAHPTTFRMHVNGWFQEVASQHQA